MSKEKLGVLIGRFQLGPHLSHIELMVKAASQVDRLMILVGSANQRISPKNPFTYQERRDMIIRSLWDAGVFNIIVEPSNDYRYSDEYWCNSIRKIVGTRRTSNENIKLFGHHKDSSSFYLDLFPEWECVELSSNDESLSSTHLREIWLSNNQVITAELREYLPYGVTSYLSRREYDQDLQSEYEYYKNEKLKFSNYPYLETLNFNCADVVLECAGHILLGKRKNAPGRNCWALFGGFKNFNETFFDCAIRELLEESNVRVPERVLRTNVVNSKMFDSPNRTLGIIRNTYAYHIKVDLNPDGSLPRANGGDDMREDSVQWVPTHDVVNRLVLFDDHKDIISHFTGIMQDPFIEIK